MNNPPAPPGAQPPAPVRSILVVDDVPEICQIFRDVGRRLRHEPVKVVTECNSARGMELARTGNFDVVVSDFRMREVDGLEVLRAAREHNPNGYRILMTGYSEIPTSLDRLRAASVDAYVRKPLQAPDLLKLLAGFLQAQPEHVAHERARAREIEDRVVRT